MQKQTKKRHNRPATNGQLQVALSELRLIQEAAADKQFSSKTTAPRTDMEHYRWTDALDAACALLQATIDKRNAQSRASRLKAKVTRESRRQGELFDADLGL